MKYAAAYGIALAILLVLDFAWLGIAARSLYVARIGPMMLDQPRWGVAGAFYVLYAAGLVYLAVLPGWREASWPTASLNGAVLGFTAYLTYNATNLSVMKGYDGLIAVIDTAWGTAVSAVVAGLTVSILAALASSAPA
jgi:uncharacterized membrane protein